MHPAIKKFLVVCPLWLPGCAVLFAQRIPHATELPGQAFQVKTIWPIDGGGSWDFIKVDPAYRRLLIAHGNVVQAVDLETGLVTGTIRTVTAPGLKNARAIALDDREEFGHTSDGAGNEVLAFDRRTLKVVARIPSGASPRDPPAASVIAIIDAETWTPRAALLLGGRAGLAETDGQGRVFVIIADQSADIRLEAQAIEDSLDEEKPNAAKDLKNGKNIYTSIADGARDALSFSSPDDFQKSLANMVPLNWQNISLESRPPGSLYRICPLGTECSKPHGLSVDGAHLRLFVACRRDKLAVVNADNGHLVSIAPAGYGTGAIEFDAARGLIYAANGDGGGTLTIIHQHVTDSYDVVARLPTMRRARVLAGNPTSGEVYLVTDAGESGLAVLVADH